jgi:hypothetical protein
MQLLIYRARLLIFVSFAFSFILNANEMPEKMELGRQDYKVLIKKCGGDSCCETSARRAQKSKGYVLLKREGRCAPGFERNILKCISSYVWCVPRK